MTDETLDSSLPAEANQSKPLPPRREATPWTIAFVTVLTALIGFTLIGPFIGLMIAYPMYDGEPMDFITDVGNPVGKEYMRSLMMIVQGASTLIGLAVVPTLFWMQLKRKKVTTLFTDTPLNPMYLWLAAGTIIFFIGLDSVIIEWNSNLDLPDGAFETFAKDLKERTGTFVKWLVAFPNAGHYVIGVIVIAILPAIGEELVFRGFLQPELQKSFKNPHIGIWVAAILFSALHMQFYGFFPRIFLGALMGYMYYWSKNMWVPILAHFVNNMIAVTMLYVSLKHMPELNFDDTEAMPWYIVISSGAIFVALLYRFYSLRKTADDVRS